MACNEGYMVKTYNESDLYKQLRYYHFMFDLPKYEQSRKLALSIESKNVKC